MSRAETLAVNGGPRVVPDGVVKPHHIHVSDADRAVVQALIAEDVLAGHWRRIPVPAQAIFQIATCWLRNQCEPRPTARRTPSRRPSRR